MNKTESISLRLSPEIRERIKSCAEKAEMTMTEFVISSCLKNKVIVLSDGEEIAKELHRVRMAVNGRTDCQIVDMLNNIVLKLNKICEEIERISATDTDIFTECNNSEDEIIEDEDWMEWEENSNGG